ncbi:HlyD family secretion protein [Leptothermofonsia sp. ETS-13]|uniref:HlyD family secretion protein n=1 Tax=Leptothermofonsia sp. ETS-13 TaxID=3035696 RepID=UPI003BA048F9
MSQTITPPETAPAGSESLPSRLHKPRSKILIPVGIGAIAAIAGSMWYFLARPIDTGLRLSGRIEGYETDIGAKTGGRVDFVAVREGDEVKQGQLVVRINDDEVQAQLRGAEARIAAARKQEQQARVQIDVIENQIRESQIGVVQAQQDTQGRVYQAQANVATAEAQLKEAQAQLNLANVNRDRYAQLYQEGAAKKIEFDQAQTAYETAQAKVEAVNKQVAAARGALALAEASNLNPYIRNAQTAALVEQRKRAIAALQAAQAEVKNAVAGKQQIQAQIAFLNVTSPIDGVVTARAVEPGAVVTSGRTLLTVIDLNTVYMRGFLPAGEIGKVRIGQPAKVFLDSNPTQPLNARVAAVDSQASFTPENIYFRDDRVRQAFGIKLAIDKPGGYAKPGMPADAEIVVE